MNKSDGYIKKNWNYHIADAVVVSTELRVKKKERKKLEKFQNVAWEWDNLKNMKFRMVVYNNCDSWNYVLNARIKIG